MLNENSLDEDGSIAVAAGSAATGSGYVAYPMPSGATFGKYDDVVYPHQLLLDSWTLTAGMLEFLSENYNRNTRA